MIFDFHAHCYPENLAKKAMSVYPKEIDGPFFDGTLDGLKDYAKKYDVDRVLTLHIANRPEHTQTVNNWAIECASQGVDAFGSVHPRFADFKGEIARLKQNGIKGLKFHPYYQHCDLCDPFAMRVYEEAAKQDMIMLLHPGLDILVPGDFGTTDKLANLLDNLKYDKIVAAHLGGSLTYDLAEKLIWGRNVYLDTSLALRFLSDDQIKLLMDTHDPLKLIFGIDGPWAEPTPDFEIINRLFDKNMQDLLYYKNALRLLGEEQLT